MMTLGIMIGTSSGIVICTDFVNTSKTHTILKDIKNEIDLHGEIWEIVNDGEYGYATPNSNLSETDTIISTSPNVKKMFQIETTQLFSHLQEKTTGSILNSTKMVSPLIFQFQWRHM